MDFSNVVRAAGFQLDNHLAVSEEQIITMLSDYRTMILQQREATITGELVGNIYIPDSSPYDTMIDDTFTEYTYLPDGTWKVKKVNKRRVPYGDSPFMPLVYFICLKTRFQFISDTYQESE